MLLSSASIPSEHPTVLTLFARPDHVGRLAESKQQRQHGAVCTRRASYWHSMQQLCAVTGAALLHTSSPSWPTLYAASLVPYRWMSASLVPYRWMSTSLVVWLCHILRGKGAAPRRYSFCGANWKVHRLHERSCRHVHALRECAIA